eukprot:UN28452
MLIHDSAKRGHSSDDIDSLAHHLTHQHHLTCLSYDQRGSKPSKGKATFRCNEEVKDANAVCNWLVEGYDCPVVAFGVGSGGCVAGSLAARNDNVIGTVTIGYPLNFFPSLF